MSKQEIAKIKNQEKEDIEEGDIGHSFFVKFFKKFLSRGRGYILDGGSVYLESPMHDILPYACYYDKNTVLTKNGELLQTIKISDFYCSSGDSRGIREVIRDIIRTDIADSKVSFYFHTVRSKKKIDMKHVVGKSQYADDLYRSYNKERNDGFGYFNDLYITLTMMADDRRFSLFNVMSDLYFAYVKKGHNRYLEKVSQTLNEYISKLMEGLEGFGVNRLAIIKGPNGYISEHLSFFNYLLSFDNVKMYLPMGDLSRELTEECKIAFGFNVAQVMGRIGKKRYTSVIILKDYVEMSGAVLDKLLQVQRRLVITQNAMYTIPAKDVQYYAKYQEWFDMSNSPLSDMLNIKEMSNKKGMQVSDFCQHLITVTVVGDNKEELENGVKEVSEALAMMGIVAHRSDVRLEQCFWSRFPSNFNFLEKQYSILSREIAGFTELHSFATGPMNGRGWGHAVALFYSINDNYYFFNFHNKSGEGHVMVISDFMASHENVINYIVASAMKFDIRVMYLDSGRKSELFIKSLGKKYVGVESGFSPFSIEDSEEAREFMTEVLMDMRGLHGMEEEALKKVCRVIIDAIFTKFDIDKRKLSNIHKTLGKLKGDLGKWYGQGSLSKIFDNNDSYAWDYNICGIDMSPVIAEGHNAVLAVIRYCLKYFELSLNTQPTVLVIEDAHFLKGYFKDKTAFLSWMDMMSSNNVVVIFTFDVENIEFCGEFAEWVSEKIDTKMIFPLKNLTKGRAQTLGLTEKERDEIRSMCGYDVNFFLKQDGEYEILKFDVLGLDEASVLSSNPERIRVMEEVIKKVGSEDPKKWLKHYYSSAKKGYV